MSPAPDGSKWVWKLALAAITLTGLVMRLWGARASLWIDELHTAWVAVGPAAELPLRAAIGNQSPLYFLLPWLAVQLGGQSELMVRLPSLTAGIALIPAVYWVVLQWARAPLAALVAATLVALDTHCIFYAQEARPYVFVQLVALLHVYIFSRLLDTPRAALHAIWVLSGALLFYLHYTAILIVAGELGCWLIGWLIGFRRPCRGRVLALDVLGLLLCCLPATAQLLDIAARREQWSLFISQRKPWAVLQLFHLSHYVLVPLGLLAIVVAVQLLCGRRPLLRKSNLHIVLLVACWFCLPAMAAWLVSSLDLARLFFERYLIAVALAPIVAAALCVAACPTRVDRALVAAGTILVALWGASPAIDLPTRGEVALDLRREGWRSAIQYIRESSSDEPIFLRTGLVETDALPPTDDTLLREYATLPLHSIYRLNLQQRSVVPLAYGEAAPLDAGQRMLVSSAGGAWLLLRGRPATVDAVTETILNSLQTGGRPAHITQRKQYGGVTVVRIELAD